MAPILADVRESYPFSLTSLKDAEMEVLNCLNLNLNAVTVSHYTEILLESAPAVWSRYCSRYVTFYTGKYNLFISIAIITMCTNATSAMQIADLSYECVKLGTFAPSIIAAAVFDIAASLHARVAQGLFDLEFLPAAFRDRAMRHRQQVRRCRVLLEQYHDSNRISSAATRVLRD